MFKRLRRRFGTLRWKLTWSYVWISLVLSLIINVVVFAAILGFTPIATAAGMQTLMQEYVQDLRPVIADNSDPKTLQAVMRTKFSEANLRRFATQSSSGLQTNVSVTWTELDDAAFLPTSTDPLTKSTVILLLDRDRMVLAGTYLASYPAGSAWRDPVIKNRADIVDAAFANVNNPRQLVATIEQRIVMATPVRDEQGNVLAVVYFRSNPIPSDNNIALFFLSIITIVSVIFTFIINGLIGLIYGWFVSRGFTRRLNQLNQASAAFATGHLTTRISDESNDEIGQLGRQFNSMAQQIETNVRELRQLAERNAALAEQTGQLAIIEERNRLARDLHDSVSQELFSVTMLAAAAHNLLPDQPDQARSHVEQLNQMAQRALHEIRGLIFALRPAALGDQGLAPALRQLRDEAQRRQGLTVDLNITGERRLPLEHEQALYRITQETLANVIKHSGVHHARVDLEYADDQTVLTISDAGKGFDPNAPRNAHSLGLISINERATAVGGAVHVQSEIEKGTSVVVRIPRG